MSEIAKLCGMISDAAEAIRKGNAMHVGVCVERALKLAVAMRQAEKKTPPPLESDAPPATPSGKLATCFHARVTETRIPYGGLSAPAEITLDSAIMKMALHGAMGPIFGPIAESMYLAQREDKPLRVTLTIEPAE